MKKKIKIAVYGLSTETEKELPKLLQKYNVIGLLDGFQSTGELYGYPIITMKYALDCKIEKIIVIARPGSCMAITKRIGQICKENQIELFDIRGKNLLENLSVKYDFQAIKGYKYNEIARKIRAADIVSFDLFETLVVRKTLFSSDVIEIALLQFKDFGVEISELMLQRLAAEKQLSQKYAPTLYEIYEEMLKENKYPINASEFVKVEYKTDLSLLVPRKDTIKLMEEARKQGKKIYITTDSYYNKAQILNILEKNDIKNYDDVLVSSEYKTGKTQKLFEVLVNKEKSKKILHIGNDIVSDIQSAEEHGIQGCFVYSPQELFELLGGLGLSEYTDDLTDRIRIGMFVAHLFNSPFCFEDIEQKLCIKNSFDIGYLCLAPMICDFTIWFGKQVKLHNCKNVWFAARDGYLIKKLFSTLYPEIASEYFLTSRIATIRAGVENKNDIYYVDSMKFSGTNAQMLKKRFGIEIESNYNKEENCLVAYENTILEAAKQKRKNYKEYIKQLKLKSGGIAFFDFVAKGTSQMFIERLIDNPMTGFYFLQLEPEYMKEKNLKIVPFYKEDERENSAIFEYYYILETILTSPKPSVEEFTKDGKPIYAYETRTDNVIDCFMKVQDGVIKYVEDFIKICPDSEYNINKKMDEIFLSLIRNIVILDEEFLSLNVEDPFFNRITKLQDIM